MISLLVLVLVLGIIGELFVPTLPLDIPRREFGLYSWLALLQSQARGIARIPWTSTNWSFTYRSCDLRRPMTSRNSSPWIN